MYFNNFCVVCTVKVSDQKRYKEHKTGSFPCQFALLAWGFVTYWNLDLFKEQNQIGKPRSRLTIVIVGVMLLQ